MSGDPAGQAPPNPPVRAVGAGASGPAGQTGQTGRSRSSVVVRPPASSEIAIVRPITRPTSVVGGPAGERAAAAAYLRRTLTWNVILRVVFIVLLVAATILYQRANPSWLSSPSVRALALASAALYVTGLVFAAIVRGERWLMPTAYVLILSEVMAATGLTLVTGAEGSIFQFLFVVATINGAVTLFQPGAFTAAAASTLGYWASLVLETQGGLFGLSRIDLVGGNQPLLPLSEALFLGGVNMAAFMFVAVLASYLTERARRTDAQLTRTESQFANLATLHESILQAIPSGVLTMNGAGRVVFANEAVAQMLGRPSIRLLGNPLSKVLPGLNLDEARGEGCEFVYLPDASVASRPRRIQARVMPLSVGGSASTTGEAGAADQPGDTLLVLNDLTELREMTDRVARAEKMAALGKLSAGLAHEVRNPLASVYSAIELLARRVSDAQAQRLMNIVLRETERVNDLIGDFLTFARPATPESRDFDLSQLMSDTADLLAGDSRFAGRNFVIEIAPHVAMRGDPKLVKQVVWNLLINAMQATPDGARVGLTVAPGSPEGPEGFVAITVWDEGPGMRPDVAARAFDPFFTTKPNGTGLGLAIVFRLVEGMGGSVDLDTAPGQGARFDLRLPVVIAPNLSQTGEGDVDAGPGTPQ